MNLKSVVVEAGKAASAKDVSRTPCVRSCRGVWCQTMTLSAIGELQFQWPISLERQRGIRSTFARKQKPAQKKKKKEKLDADALQRQ